jgi:hypothetical protein
MGSIATVRPDRVFRRDSRTPASCSIQSLLGRQLDDSTTMKEPITCRCVVHCVIIYYCLCTIYNVCKYLHAIKLCHTIA